MSDSRTYTIGSALRRAENDDLWAHLLADGHWFEGSVTGLDGDGVLLASGEGEIMIRLTSISVVRLVQRAQAPDVHLLPEPQAADVVRLTPIETAYDEPVLAPVAALVDAEPVLELEPEPVAMEEYAEPVAEEQPEPGPSVPSVIAQLAMVSRVEEEWLEGLPDDITEAEKSALIQHRMLHAQQEAEALGLAAPQLPEVAEVVEVEDVVDEPAEVVEEPEAPGDADYFAETEVDVLPEVAPLAVEPLVDVPVAVDQTIDHVDDAGPAPERSTTQTDDWRAMLVSIRQQAAEVPAEPEKRKTGWRLAR